MEGKKQEFTITEASQAIIALTGVLTYFSEENKINPHEIYKKNIDKAIEKIKKYISVL